MEEKPAGNILEIENLTKKGHQYLQDGDMDNSYVTYEKALSLAQNANDAFTIRACLFNLGACCVAKNEAQQGLEFLLRAVPPERHTDGVLNYCDLYYNMAIAYELLSKRSDAKRCYETALKGYQEYSNSEMVAETCLKLGGTLAALGSLKEAVKVFHDGEKVYQQLLDQRHEVLCLSSRATLLAEMRDDECQILLNRVVDRVETLENDSLKAKVYSDIGLVHTSSGHFDIASEYLDKSLNLLRSVDQRDKKLQASVYQNLGAVHNQLGQYVKAIMYHEKAIELYGVTSMRYAQGHSFSNLGFAFGQLGELEKSQEHFTHALQAAKDCQDFRGQWQAYEGLSAVHFQKKNYEKAVNCLKTALTVLSLGDVNDIVVQERIVAKLSNALERQLTDKQTSEKTNKQLKIDDKTTFPKEDKGKDRSFKVQVDTHGGIDGSLQGHGEGNVGSLLDKDPKESIPKVGHVRPREKNHKFIARGLHIDDPSSENEHSDASDSTFDTISSYSGQTSSMQEGPSEAGSVHTLSNLESTAGSSGLPARKKDPLNNTYEEPQDIIQVIETGKLRLHELPPGPRDTVLASMHEDTENQQVTTLGEHRNKEKTRSTICVIQ